MCIPEIDEAFALDALKQLLVIEKDWVPSRREPPFTSAPPSLPWIPF